MHLVFPLQTSQISSSVRRPCNSARLKRARAKYLRNCSQAKLAVKQEHKAFAALFASPRGC